MIEFWQDQAEDQGQAWDEPRSRRISQDEDQDQEDQDQEDQASKLKTHSLLYREILIPHFCQKHFSHIIRFLPKKLLNRRMYIHMSILK